MEDIIETFQKLMMVHVDLFRVLMMMMRTSSFFSLGHWVNGRLALMFGSQKALLGLIGKQGKLATNMVGALDKMLHDSKDSKDYIFGEKSDGKTLSFCWSFGGLKFKNYAHLFNEVLHLIKLLHHHLHRFLVKCLGEFFNWNAMPRNSTKCNAIVAIG